jgi:hypothetical protein
MTRLQAIQYLRYYGMLSIHLLGGEPYLGQEHWFRCTIILAFKKLLRATFKSDLSMKVFPVRNITPRQVLHFIKRHFER